MYCTRVFCYTQSGHCEDLVVEFTAFGTLLVLKLTLNRYVIVLRD